MADKTQTENEPSTTPTPTPAEAEAEGGETSMDSGVVPMIGVFCASTILLVCSLDKTILRILSVIFLSFHNNLERSLFFHLNIFFVNRLQHVFPQ